jgi:hypothetical protein
MGKYEGVQGSTGEYKGIQGNTKEYSGIYKGWEIYIQ